MFSVTVYYILYIIIKTFIHNKGRRDARSLKSGQSHVKTQHNTYRPSSVYIEKMMYVKYAQRPYNKAIATRSTIVY